MSRPFDSFVLLAEMRTGSNLLESLLNALPGVACHGEAFNRAHLGGQGGTALLGVSIRERDRDPFALLHRIREQPGLNGFRLFHDHDLRVLDTVLADRRCAKIVLGRNPVDSWVSLQIARRTRKWLMTDLRGRRNARIEFDAADFDAFLAARAAFRARIHRALQVTGQTAFFLDYEDLRDAEILSGLAVWLGHDGALDAGASRMVVQNPEPLAEKIADLPGMAADLARIDYFGLSRLPNFEPRRGPAVSAVMAAADAPVLWLPLAPEPRVEGWLTALGGGEPVRDFTRASLERWKSARSGFRAVTVLRHPLERADRAFREAILTGRYARIRRRLIRDHGVGLPDPADAAGMTPGAYRAALLGFLGFLKCNLNGQTAIRVDRRWCSQVAALAALAPAVLPDVIARADPLEEDLAHVARGAGLSPVPLPALEATPPVPLAEIYGADLEEAARAAYPRDIAAFGFGRWHPEG